MRNNVININKNNSINDDSCMLSLLLPQVMKNVNPEMHGLSSYVMKTIVMHLIMETSDIKWDEDHLPEAFLRVTLAHEVNPEYGLE